jgi:tryptophan synthase alpha chain
MNARIAAAFERLAREERIALIPYLTAGYPSLQATAQLIATVLEQGADLIEIGVPFSDPMADGATVQRASHAALENGVTPIDCLKLAAEVRGRDGAGEVPLLFMSYFNPIHKYGVERFAGDCADAGVDGLIIPDLPPEEAGGLRVACEHKGMDLVFLVAPTSTDERLRRVAAMASGFVYCVSLAGVTGARSEVGGGMANLVGRVRRFTPLPLVVGFGISRPEHVASVAAVADGAVVGSALINIVESAPEGEMEQAVAGYIRGLKGATTQAVAAGAQA